MQLSSLRLAIGLSTVGCLFFIMSFGSPYWYESRYKAVSPFVRIGLWEVCFDGFVHPSDAMNKAYTGCIWIFSKQLFWIRFWLLPAWFVTCQVFATLAMMLALSSYFLQLYMFLHNYSEIKRNIHIVTLSFSLTAGVFQFIAILVFGISAKSDWDWMINPVYNYLSWSYGFAIMASVFSLFASVVLRKFWVKSTLMKPAAYEYPHV